MDSHFRTWLTGRQRLLIGAGALPAPKSPLVALAYRIVCLSKRRWFAMAAMITSSRSPRAKALLAYVQSRSDYETFAGAALPPAGLAIIGQETRGSPCFRQLGKALRSIRFSRVRLRGDSESLAVFVIAETREAKGARAKVAAGSAPISRTSACLQIAG